MLNYQMADGPNQLREATPVICQSLVASLGSSPEGDSSEPCSSLTFISDSPQSSPSTTASLPSTPNATPNANTNATSSGQPFAVVEDDHESLEEDELISQCRKIVNQYDRMRKRRKAAPPTSSNTMVADTNNGNDLNQSNSLFVIEETNNLNEGELPGTQFNQSQSTFRDRGQKRTIREGPSNYNSWTIVCQDGKSLTSSPWDWQVFFKEPERRISNTFIDCAVLICAAPLSHASPVAHQNIRTDERRDLAAFYGTIFMTPIFYPGQDHHAIIFFQIHGTVDGIHYVDVISFSPVAKPTDNTIRQRLCEIFPCDRLDFPIRVMSNQIVFCQVQPSCYSRLVVLYGLLGLEVLCTNPSTIAATWTSFSKVLQPMEEEDECYRTLGCVKQAAFRIGASTSFSFKQAFVDCLEGLEGIVPWRPSPPVTNSAKPSYSEDKIREPPQQQHHHQQPPHQHQQHQQPPQQHKQHQRKQQHSQQPKPEPMPRKYKYPQSLLYKKGPLIKSYMKKSKTMGCHPPGDVPEMFSEDYLSRKAGNFEPWMKRHTTKQYTDRLNDTLSFYCEYRQRQSYHFDEQIDYLENDDNIRLEPLLTVSKERFHPLLSNLKHHHSVYWHRETLPLSPKQLYGTVHWKYRASSLRRGAQALNELAWLKVRMVVPPGTFAVDFTICPTKERYGGRLRVYEGYQAISVLGGNFRFARTLPKYHGGVIESGVPIPEDPFAQLTPSQRDQFLYPIVQVCRLAISRTEFGSRLPEKCLQSDDVFKEVHAMKDIICVFTLPMYPVWFQFHPVYDYGLFPLVYDSQ